jgi:hypothetical protein
MKLKFTLAAACAIALVAAPTAMAKSFSGTVSGDGISANYTIKNQGKKVCVTYGGSSSSNEPEEIKFSVKGEGSLKYGNPLKSKCVGDKGFAKALKKANKVKAKGTGAYGEKFKGTLK